MTNGPLVPDVLDETTASAQRKLEAVGLKVGTISTEKNPGGIPGTVLRTSPDRGSSVPQGSAVDLVIIEAADALVVPNVVGLSRPKAEEQLKQAGLRVGNVFTERSPEFSDLRFTGTVVRTSPGAGGQAAPNSGVDLFEVRDLTIMPDFINGDAGLIIVSLRRLGHRVAVIQLHSFLGGAIDDHPATIVKQSPPAGSSLIPQQDIEFSVTGFFGFGPFV